MEKIILINNFFLFFFIFFLALKKIKNGHFFAKIRFGLLFDLIFLYEIELFSKFIHMNITTKDLKKRTAAFKQTKSNVYIP